MTKEKYLSEKPNHIAHCPSCRGVILRDAQFESGKASFIMRCPHCRHDIEVRVAGNTVTVKEAPAAPAAKQP